MGSEDIPKRENLPFSERLGRLAVVAVVMVIEAGTGALRGAIDGVNDVRLALHEEQLEMDSIEDYANGSDNRAEPS